MNETRKWPGLWSGLGRLLHVRWHSTTRPSDESRGGVVIDGTDSGAAGFDPCADARNPPFAAHYIAVPVAENVTIWCRFFKGDPCWPSILFFHGNGEVPSDYDSIAPLFLRAGTNLFVASYRGYGPSGGTASLSSILSDAHTLLAAFGKILDEQRYSASRFVMGRSLGAHPAVELAVHSPHRLRGLILSNGVAWPRRGSSLVPANQRTGETENLEHQDSAIALPTLIIHGDRDEVFSYAKARRFYEALTTDDKLFVTVAGAGHNDVFQLAPGQYADAIGSFVRRHSQAS